MIKRIRSIKQVGVFANLHNGNPFEFNKLTFIYGLNTYGKTTLCDIFHSLSKDDSSIIQKRKSIPYDFSGQAITFSILDESNLPKEKNLEFKNNQWNKNDMAKKLEIFDTNFINENVFTGQIIERKNKENFTDFILGEDSVKIANQLQADKKIIADKKRELKKIIPQYVAEKSDKEIQDFINLKVNSGLDVIKINLVEKQSKLRDTQENEKKSSIIINMKEPSLLTNPSYGTLKNNVRRINDLLDKRFDSLKEEAVRKLKEHIKRVLCNSNDAEEWIRNGLILGNNNQGNACPFCGQDISNAKDLIDAYHAYFSEEYLKFMSAIEEDIDVLYSSIKPSFKFSTEISTALIISKDYVSIIKELSYDQDIKNLEKSKNEIETLEEKLDDLVSIMKSELKILIKEKKKNPYKKVNVFSKLELDSTIELYLSKVCNANTILKKIIDSISLFKEKYQTGAIMKEITVLKHEVDNLEIQKYRIEQDKQCQHYLTLQEDIYRQQEAYTKSSEKLEASQTQYLINYFSIINKIYNKLGSNNFKIESKHDTRGYKKVFGLIVKYKNKTIKDSELPYVFSESDRRALALAIFWTKIMIKGKSEKEKTIIILDDPVTSFDDNRITNTTNIIIENLDSISQIIIISHYTNFIKRFVEICKRADCSYLQLLKDANTCYIERLDLRDFVLNENQKRFFKLYEFVNNNHSNDVRTELRTFFEEQLKMLFYKTIEENGIGTCTLNELLNRLNELDAIDIDTTEKLHRFRETMNPDSHIFTSNNIEDVRSFAKELLDYLYSIKFKNES